MCQDDLFWWHITKLQHLSLRYQPGCIMSYLTGGDVFKYSISWDLLDSTGRRQVIYFRVCVCVCGVKHVLVSVNTRTEKYEE